MRLRDPRVVHLLVLYALPVVVAAAGWGVPAAVGTALAAFLLGMAARLFMSLRALRQPERPLRLHTITFSHYAEKARWCLDRLGVPYEEVPNAGILGVLLTGRTVPWLEVPPGMTRVGDSARILRYLWGEYAGRLPGACGGCCAGRLLAPPGPGTGRVQRSRTWTGCGPTAGVT